MYVWYGEGIAQEASEQQALEWYRSGQFELAADAFRRILTLRPYDPVALYHLGCMERNPNAARQLFLQLVHHAPQHDYVDDALLAVGRSYFQNRQYPIAIRSFNLLLSAYPASDLDDQTRYWLGRSLLADRQWALARLTFQQLIARHPASLLVTPAHLGIADTYRDAGDPIEAARAYLKLEMDHTAGDSLQVILFRAGECLDLAGKKQEALHVYKRLIAQFPESQEAVTVRKRLSTSE